MNTERFEELKRNYLPRFWDTENKVMIYPEMFFPCNEITMFIRYNIGQVLPEILALDEMLLNPRFIPMRPTGHFDKNNNLIYQDDTIVYYKNGGATCFGGRREAVVKWHEDWCRWIIETEFGDAYGLNERDEPIKIIGNIHSTNTDTKE